jgi:hypothetical protein
VSALAEKKKKERRGGPARGDGRRAAGPSGLKGKQGMVLFFFFLFFKLLFQTIFFSNSNQTFSNFFSRIL